MTNCQAPLGPGRGRNVENRIRDLLATRTSLTSGDLARELGVTRQAVHPYLRQLVHQGELRALGAGRGAHYERVAAFTGRYPLAGLAEDRVWDDLRKMDRI